MFKGALQEKFLLNLHDIVAPQKPVYIYDLSRTLLFLRRIMRNTRPVLLASNSQTVFLL
jgi:hypothetical protein